MISEPEGLVSKAIPAHYTRRRSTVSALISITGRCG